MRHFLLGLLMVSAVLGQDRALPNATLKDMRNRPVQIQKQTKGDIVLVNFWATYCVPCRKEMPLLNDLQQKYKQQGVQVIGVAIDDSRTVGRVSSVIRALKVDYGILLDTEQKLYKNFNTSAMPFSILVNREGTIVWEHTGYIPGDEKKMESEILKLLANTETAPGP